MQQTIDIRDYVAGKREETAARSAPLGLEALFKPGITDSDVAAFFTQLSVMLGARVQLHKALEILSRQIKNRAFGAVISGLLAEIRRGSPFSKALGMNPQVFDELMVVTAEVGQESGLLAEVLSGLAEYLEKMNALKKRLVQALTYPVLVLTVAAAAVGFLLVFIVPTFAEMFRSFDMTLPWSTEAVLTLSEILTQYGLLAFIGCPGLWFVFRRSLKSESVRTKLEEWIPKIPFIGEIILKNYIARFCRTLGTQLKAQVSLLDALETTRRIIPNRTLKAEIGGIIRIARQGRGVTSSIASSRLFPPMVAQMLMVGEESSELDEMLLKVAEYYEMEIDGTIEGLSSVIEPIIVLILGLAIGALLVAMYMPMFDLVAVIGS